MSVNNLLLSVSPPEEPMIFTPKWYFVDRLKKNRIHTPSGLNHLRNLQPDAWKKKLELINYSLSCVIPRYFEGYTRIPLFLQGGWLGFFLYFCLFVNLFRWLIGFVSSFTKTKKEKKLRIVLMVFFLLLFCKL